MNSIWDWLNPAPQQPEGLRDDRGAPYNNGYGTAAPDFWHAFGNADWNTASGNVGQFMDAQKQQAGQQGENGALEEFKHQPQQRKYKWLKFKGLLDG